MVLSFFNMPVLHIVVILFPQACVISSLETELKIVLYQSRLAKLEKLEQGSNFCRSLEFTNLYLHKSVCTIPYTINSMPWL